MSLSASPVVIPRRRRVRAVPAECPNPLFLKWLTEWRDEAASKQLKTKYVYEKALRSLRKYPLKLKSGREAIVLEYFGQKICDMLDKKLLEVEGHLERPGTLNKADFGISRISVPSINGSPTKNTKTTKPRTYVPVPNTASYALLMALHNAGHGSVMKKQALMEAAQPMCEKSFSVPDPGSYYTAWSSMSTLLSKGLVIKESNPAKYSLTDTGSDLVVQLLNSQGKSNDFDKASTTGKYSCPQSKRLPIFVDSDDDNNNAEVGSSQSDNNYHELNQFKLLPGEFDVILCVDNCEAVGGVHIERKLMVQSELRKNGVNFDVRKLHVGDFLWIAKERVTAVPGSLQPPKARELILDYIIERKRKDDLAASIIDGRFHEQKYRMKNCNLKNCIYLIEDFGSVKNHMSLPETSLDQAIANTQIIDGFFIKHTKDVTESVAYLTIMTRYLQSIYSKKILCSISAKNVGADQGDTCSLMTFDEFNRSSMKVKPPSITELFVKQLVQIPGISVDRAKGIVCRYPTPATLFNRYIVCNTQAERDKMLANIQYGQGRRNLGPSCSKLISQFYNTNELS